MGIFSDRQVAFFEDARIEVHGTVTLLGGKFRLVVQGEQAAEVNCNVGSSATLRGRLKRAEGDKQVEVAITQTWLGTRFRLLIDGQEHRLHRAL